MLRGLLRRWAAAWTGITNSVPNAAQPRRFLRAKYDAAATNHDNYRHWANADGLSANAANSPEVRKTLRNRARYEIANNSYARGITLTQLCLGASRSSDLP